MAEGITAWRSRRRSKIWTACQEEWSKWNATNQTFNYADCSGFVKAVASRLTIPIKDGQANDIFDYCQTGNARKEGWSINGQGADACEVSALAADEGDFAIAVWKNSPGKNGHVAILASYMPNTLEQYDRTESKTVAFWGALGGVGQLYTATMNSETGAITVKGRLSESFGTSKHPSILYASYSNWCG